MTDTPIVPVILCGGSGTRLWPRSRASCPKPFLPLVGDSTLFEATVARCAAETGFAPPVVVTGAAHLAHVEAQLGGIAGAEVIVEPAARNTAAAIALAALRLPEDAVMLVCPSDHHIADTHAFQAAARAAAELAREGWLVSFGIEASAPETGFGYLQRGEPIGMAGYRTARFVEKPILNAPARSSPMAAMPGTAESSLSGSAPSWKNSPRIALRSPRRPAPPWPAGIRMERDSIPIPPLSPRFPASLSTMR